LVIDTDEIRIHSDFKNPYAKAKAMAAYELTKRIAEINVRACFVEKEKEKYIPLVACAHEIAQVAARLAEEAREIEKYSDTLVRRPHSKDGKPKVKDKLLLSPAQDEEAFQKWLK
jgi:methylenetetrahydromethanopterin dehydrogenase